MLDGGWRKTKETAQHGSQVPTGHAITWVSPEPRGGGFIYFQLIQGKELLVEGPECLSKWPILPH